MKFSLSYVALLALAAMPAVQAHIALADPVPINDPKNPNTKSPDTDYTAPIKDKLCRGHLGAGADALKPVAKWAAGSAAKFTLRGSAIHNGGSCQASFSEDGGKTFRAVKTWIGGCPVEGGGTFNFNVPKDVKNGDVIFAWSWFNKVGVREMYMNCASVTITGGGSGLKGDQYPEMFKANINGVDCKTVDNKDVKIPNPGPNTEVKSTDAAPPVGAGCGPTGSSPPPQNPPPVQNPPPQNSPPPQNPPKDQPQPQTGTQAPPPPAPVNGGACTNGQIICTSATTWALCSGNQQMNMGNVAPGTKCVNGAITKRSVVRFSEEHLTRSKQ